MHIEACLTAQLSQGCFLISAIVTCSLRHQALNIVPVNSKMGHALVSTYIDCCPVIKLLVLEPEEDRVS